MLREDNTGAKAAGRSRTAILAATALSVTAMSLGGLGAAAYVGVLPDQVQQAMHDAVGAPAPSTPAPGTRGNGTTEKPGRNPVTPPTAGVGPRAAGSPAAGLCRAWAVDKAKGTARDHSVAFRNLSGTAGGADRVEAYCAVVLAAKPGKGSASPTADGTHPTKTPHPTTSSTTKTPSPHSPTSKTSTPKSPAKGGATGGATGTQGKPANTSTSTTSTSTTSTSTTSTSTTVRSDTGTTTRSRTTNLKSSSKGPRGTNTP